MNKTQATENPIALHACGIVKNFQHDKVDQDVLHGIDLEIKRGEFLAIMGPSGCGKSTLLHILGLMLSPSSASELSIDGEDVLHLSQSQKTRIRREKIGFVFQRFNLIDVLSASDNLKLALKLRRQKIDGRVDELLNMIGLEAKKRHKPSQMSTGEQQRLAFARAVIHNPLILLADEPTGNLDSENTGLVMSYMQDYNKNHGQTTLMVTHNPELAKHAERVINIRDGRIIH